MNASLRLRFSAEVRDVVNETLSGLQRLNDFIAKLSTRIQAINIGWALFVSSFLANDGSKSIHLPH
jgi:hypothetical protein